MNSRLSSILHSIKRIALLLIGIPTVFFIVCVPAWLYSYFLRVDLDERLPPPGRMIDIGTHKLHINCSGLGQPTIILEPGAGIHGWSAYWNAVKERLPVNVRVCSYDRAGMGWSEQGPTPRNAKVIADELSKLLEESGESAPYLIVGHSFGGTIALSFLEKNSASAVGFVAVEVPTYTFMKWRRETRFILGGKLRVMVTPALSVIQTAFDVFSSVDVNESPYSTFSDYERNAIQDTGFRTRMIANIFKEDSYLESAEPKEGLGALPLVVIQGAASIFASEEWDKNQQELLSLSAKSKFIYVDSAGHGVPSQAPESIVEGINWILANTVPKESE